MNQPPMAPERYQEILDALSDPSLRIKLSSNPTTMGPRYVSEMITRILSAKSTVNDLAEEVDKAYTKAQVLRNNLDTELALRTDLELNNLDPGDTDGLDAAGRKALIRQRVESSYIEDQKQSLNEGDSAPGPFQFWEDLRMAQNSETELKGLLRMLDRRRDELNKLDSGVRLQQKTIDTEISINRSTYSQPPTSASQELDRLADEFDDPDSDEPPDLPHSSKNGEKSSVSEGITS